MVERFKDPRARALYKKAMEIHELVDNILEAAPEQGAHADILKSQIGLMHADAMTIPTKIAGAEGGDLYDIRMENAAIIRKCARDLITGLRGLSMFGYDEPRYFDLLRTEMEVFRKLFVAWVKGFNTKRYVVDDWGLFNPPGVKPDDESPDLDFDEED
ncbi:MAG: hypothetical protein RBT71_06750 [Flavobacteriales bacterium]|jgi:hypothetical protein|nr:hypothetical protein [Flavobacteriales bacterium]